MIKLKLNGKKYQIPPISTLSFKELNKVVLKNNATELPEYISLYTGLNVIEVMNAEFTGLDVPSIYHSIFDVYFEKEIKTKYDTVTIKDKVYEVDKLVIDTYGKHYFFGLYYDSMKQGKINIYELSVYALAIAVSPSHDMGEIEILAKEISEMNWRDILPQSFFLLKKFSKKKRSFWIQSIRYTWGLKKITWQVKLEIHRLKRMERKQLGNF